MTFPLTFLLKVIMRSGPGEGAGRERLAAVLDELSLPHSGWAERKSGAGRYVSYSVEVTAPDRERFVLAHERMAKVEGVRCVL